MDVLVNNFEELGFKLYVDKTWQGPIIATFLYPEGRKFDFQDMYCYIKDRGYAIYPGKLTDADTFRIGVIGEIYEEDIEKLTEIMREYMAQDLKEERMMKIEGVIFDWAGTTVDYGCFAPVRAFAEIFREYGIEATMEETRKPMGMLKWDHIKTMLSMERINEAWIRVHGRPWTDRDVDEMHDKFAEKLMGISMSIPGEAICKRGGEGAQKAEY